MFRNLWRTVKKLWDRWNSEDPRLRNRNYCFNRMFLLKKRIVDCFENSMTNATSVRRKTHAEILCKIVLNVLIIFSENNCKVAETRRGSSFLSYMRTNYLLLLLVSIAQLPKSFHTNEAQYCTQRIVPTIDSTDWLHYTKNVINYSIYFFEVPISKNIFYMMRKSVFLYNLSWNRNTTFAQLMRRHWLTV